ncbi:zinc finger protein 436 [Oryzias melastigma]|uniref:zinc finger protein 436 n=1 Tax=Oryzias melastigma TaxID=30732 RepID=UPI000CF80B43|nr:zinc finger protein 436 [Oryzias melastigma]
MSSEPQEDSDREQLSAAEGIIFQNEEELCGQSRMMDIRKQLQLHVVVLPQHWMAEEEDLCNQQRNFREEQEDPELLQIKKEQEEQEPPQIEKEQGEPEFPHIKEEQEWLWNDQDEEQLDLNQETDTLMEIPNYEDNENSEGDLNHQLSFNVTDSQDESEFPRIKEEQEWLCISQGEEKFYLKQETDTLVETHTYEENDYSEADLNNQLRFNETDSQDEDGNLIEESSSTTDEETDLPNRDQRKRRDRSHVQSVASSHMLESQCDSDGRKNLKKDTLVKKCKEFTDESRYSNVKSNIRTRITNNMSGHIKPESGKRLYVCEECDRHFGYWSQFKIHMRTHTGEKPFSCQECDKRFSEISSLKRHMKTHTGEKPFSCKQCDTSFGRISDLKIHMRTHSGERPFSCEECGTRFSHASNLKTHMRSHTGEKPFNCKECEKSFSRASHLKTHMRTHSGEKPFSCEECGTSFSQVSNLKRHMKTHTGDKLFSCEEDNTGFRHSSNLKTAENSYRREAFL